MILTPKRREFYASRYRAFHKAWPKLMPGKVRESKIVHIQQLVTAARAAHAGDPKWVPRMLDYGSGKGYQYLAGRVHEQWGGILPVCYDPGVIHLAHLPKGLFDIIICTDVLEHVEKGDVLDVLAEIFSYARRDHAAYVYLHICCRPAGKSFEDGTNLHATVRQPKWWDKRISLRKPPNVKVTTTYELRNPRDDDTDADCDGDPPPCG